MGCSISQVLEPRRMRLNEELEEVMIRKGVKRVHEIDGKFGPPMEKQRTVVW